MILLLGIPSEPPLEMAAAALARLGIAHRIVNQRDAGGHELVAGVRSGRFDGHLRLGDEHLALRDVSAVYVRPTDHRVLPEREGLADEHPLARHLDDYHQRWMRMVDVLPCLVVNRLSAMATNSSKPYQTMLIRRLGIPTPDTLATSDPVAARRFIDEHDGAVIYKSVSGVRSIVRRLDDADLDRLAALDACPTQFQAFVTGDDVRVHVVGSEVHATRIRSAAADYRYARLESVDAELEPFELTDELAERCRAVARGLGLHFAGIDLRIDGSDARAQRDAVCFEVNPSPAYSYYEAHTGQPISDALARLLGSAAALAA